MSRRRSACAGRREPALELRAALLAVLPDHQRRAILNVPGLLARAEAAALRAFIAAADDERAAHIAHARRASGDDDAFFFDRQG